MSVKTGIIGAGGMADFHIRGFLQAGAEIIAVTSRTKKSAQRLAEKNNIGSVYTDINEMLKKEKDLEAVSIITPNKFHKEYAIKALNAGLHVFCEKPPALNHEDTVQMKQAADKADRILMFNFNNRARADSIAMYNYIKNGTVGRINSAQAAWIRRTGIPGFGSWFTNRELSGGGPVIDLLHMADLALFFMDFPEPEYILAATFSDFSSDRTFKGPWGIPDNKNGINNVETASHAFVKFKTGQVLFLRSSWAEMNRNEKCHVTFQGEKAGGLVERHFIEDGIDDTSIDICELYTHENGLPVNRKIITEADTTMGRVQNAANFILAVKAEEKPLNTPGQACVLMKIVDGLYKSAETGGPVKF